MTGVFSMRGPGKAMGNLMSGGFGTACGFGAAAAASWLNALMVDASPAATIITKIHRADHVGKCMVFFLVMG
jgi:hypothetical protein